MEGTDTGLANKYHIRVKFIHPHYRQVLKEKNDGSMKYYFNKKENTVYQCFQNRTRHRTGETYKTQLNTDLNRSNQDKTAVLLK